MKLTIHYKPLTVTVPAWARPVFQKALDTGRFGELCREMLDELHEYEGWAPAFERIEPKPAARRRRKPATSRVSK